MNTIKAKDLTEKEQEQFAEHFYWLSEVDDQDSPFPWGAPWAWCPEQDLEFDPEAKNRIHSAARLWLEKNQQEMKTA